MEKEEKERIGSEELRELPLGSFDCAQDARKEACILGLILIED